MAETLPTLTINLRGRLIESLRDFRDAVAEPLQAQGWSGESLDAWWDYLTP